MISVIAGFVINKIIIIIMSLQWNKIAHRAYVKFHYRADGRVSYPLFAEYTFFYKKNTFFPEAQFS